MSLKSLADEGIAYPRRELLDLVLPLVEKLESLENAVCFVNVSELGLIILLVFFKRVRIYPYIRFLQLIVLCLG